MDISNELIAKIVREVLNETANGGSAAPDFVKNIDPSGVLRVQSSTVKCEPFDVGVPANVKLKDIVTLEESPRLGCGFLEIDHSTYPWTLTYDEFYYVVDGVFDIIVDGRHNLGYPGDIMGIPKGTSVCFSSPETCRAVYFTYPADWANATL